MKDCVDFKDSVDATGIPPCVQEWGSTAMCARVGQCASGVQALANAVVVSCGVAGLSAGVTQVVGVVFVGRACWSLSFCILHVACSINFLIQLDKRVPACMKKKRAGERAPASCTDRGTGGIEYVEDERAGVCTIVARMQRSDIKRGGVGSS